MMLNFRGDYKSACIGYFVKTCSTVFSTVAVVVIPLLILLFIITFAVKSVDKIQIIYIDKWKLATHKTSTRFLSIGLDSSVIADGFNKFNLTDVKLRNMLRYLYPAYLRIGGSLGDKLYFDPNLKEPDKSTTDFYKELSCEKYFDMDLAPNYTMTGTQWLNLMNLTRNANLDVFFGLNALIRFTNGSWDYRNAESLIRFSNEHHINLNWELGNEPNSFNHKFNESVNATQLARDFITLKSILKKYAYYRKSLLAGPDTTRPLENHKESEIYLQKFLRNAIHVIDAITWHQYYINGRTAKPKDFLNPDVFDFLKTQIEDIQNITKPFDAWDKQIWLGETSSAYGGGAPNLSNAFIGSFIWVDKLGLSAKMGVKVVVRQSIFKGYYALLDDNYDPNPDWWISILYKRLVGPTVVPYYTACSSKVRLYCHCTKKNILVGSPFAVTVFGVNLASWSANIRIEGIFSSPFEEESYEQTQSTIFAFEFTSDSLFSKSVYLNDKILKMSNDSILPKFVPKVVNSRPYVTMPPFSIVFWIIPTPYVKACFL